MARPIKDYSQIIGHTSTVSWLQSRVQKDAVPNVMILHGNPGLGKTSLAKLVAIDVVTKYTPELRDKYVKAIIEDCVSCDSIKLFNMSQIQEKEEEIQKVKAELTSIGFSSTRRKVLILDEAHNMSDKAQDAILTDLEHLQEGIYVFICTTEVGALRSALVSRSKATIQLNNLTGNECRKLLRAEVDARNLQPQMSLDMFLTFVTSWAENQPRKILNFVENFDYGASISGKDLEVFIGTASAAKAITLVEYLYGSLPLGIDYINALTIDNNLLNLLVEITKVVYGGDSTLLSSNDKTYVKSLCNSNDPQRLLRFTAALAGSKTLTRRYALAAFIRNNISYTPSTPPAVDNKFQASDLQTLGEYVIQADLMGSSLSVPRVGSLEELFASSAEVED